MIVDIIFAFIFSSFKVLFINDIISSLRDWLYIKEIDDRATFMCSLGITMILIGITVGR